MMCEKGKCLISTTPELQEYPLDNVTSESTQNEHHSFRCEKTLKMVLIVLYLPMICDQLILLCSYREYSLCVPIFVMYRYGRVAFCNFVLIFFGILCHLQTRI